MPLGDPFLGIDETIQGGQAHSTQGHYKMKSKPFLEPELVKHMSGGESPWGTF